MTTEKRLIDANALAERAFTPMGAMCGRVIRITDLYTAPTVDAVEVVRCKDCVHCRYSTDPKSGISHQVCGWVGFNPVQSSQVPDDFYCAYGEMEDGGVEYENS